jgi:uncharacterized damage-inducible protein DinB
MLTNITSNTLSQLRSVIDQLTKEEYTSKLSILNHSSVGQHVRHVLEFYMCLSDGIKSGIVNYDIRTRNPAIENEPNYAMIILEELTSFFCLKNIEEASIINMIEFNSLSITSQSSVSRELVYLIEHSIHHYAIMGIALRSHFGHVSIPDNFGIAYSTTKHKQSLESEIVHSH